MPVRTLSYRTAPHAPWRAGFVLDGRVLDAAAVHDFGDRAPTVRNLLDDGAEALGAALDAAAEQTGAGVAIDTVEVGPPVPDPDKILCVGLNYADHASEARMELPEVPTIFAKFRNALVGDGAGIVLPGASDQVDYEGELLVVVGRRARDVPEADALGYVAGYAPFNDVSARDVQLQTGQWTAGKALDTFGPTGPMTAARDVPDPQALRVTTRVNGELRQDASTARMVFPVARLVAFLSSLMTLEPGDLIATGTPSGIGHKRTPPAYLRAGDVVEVEVEGLGAVSNPVVPAVSSAPRAGRAVTTA